MCGICAYVGGEAGAKYVFTGIQMLRNRGYDSIGCCSISQPQSSSSSSEQPQPQQLVITKYANTPHKDSFEALKETQSLHENSNCLMAHCRWATTGKVTDANSHPHLDTITPDQLAVVHNGIISNYARLKEYLKSKGVTFRSETDTEVIINLISYNKQLHPEYTLMDAIKTALTELEGTWALIIMDRSTPNSLYVCKKGSPILIGCSDDMCIVSSEVSGFSNYVKNYHVVPDNQILKAHFNTETKKMEFYYDSQLTTLSTKTLIHSTLQLSTPEPYPHWTLREIMEQPEAAMRAISGGGRILNENEVKLGGLKDHKDELLKIKHLTILASGTSYHAGLMGQKWMQQLSGFDTIRTVDASEFTVSDLAPEHAGVLVLSQSGETRDVIRVMEQIRSERPKVMIFSIVNVVESLIARESDCGIYLNAGREVGVASTKSFTNQVIVIMLIAIWYAQNRGLYSFLRQRLIRSIHNIKDLLQATLILMAPVCDKVLEKLKQHEHIFILGRDKGLPAALEGCLKIKEISYIHAEAYAAGSLKHGPLALVSNGTPVIVLRSGDTEVVRHMDIAAEEVKSRGAMIISIGSNKCENNIYDYEIPIAKDIYMESLLSVIPLQYLAYRLSVELNYNPDYPRNLAKCVTTD